jgi:hypothetical protein
MYLAADDKPTAQQIHDLEASHKLLFAALALANNTYCNLYKHYFPLWKKDPDYKNSFEFKTVIKLGVDIVQKSKTWFDTQYYLEKQAKIPATKIKPSDFLHPKKNVSILKQAKQYIQDWQGVPIQGEAEQIGIIPLIIWGVIVLAAAISAAYVVNRLTVSTKDREELLAKTEQTCKDLNLTPEQCANMVTATQHEETQNAQGVTEAANAVGGGLMKIVLFGTVIYFGFQLINSKKS